MPGPSLVDLPQELVGIIYSKLPDAVSRQALFSSCSAIRSNTCILSALSGLTIRSSQLSTSKFRACNPLTTKLGRSLQLRTLVVDGYDVEKAGDALEELLQPADEETRTAVSHTLQSLQELELLDWDFGSEPLALGCTVAALPRLRTLRVTGYSSSSISSIFLACLAAGRPSHQLQNLDVSCCTISREQVPAISRLHGLETLAVGMKSSYSELAGLGSLQQLREVSIDSVWIDVLHPEDAGDGTWIGMLRQLQKLALPTTPANPMLQALPPSLECLRISRARVTDFMRLLLLIQSADWLPRLQCIELEALLGGEVHPWPEHFAWLRPQLQITCFRVHLDYSAHDADNVWDGFRRACEQAPPHFASSIQHFTISGHLPHGLFSHLALCTSLKRLGLYECGTTGIVRVQEGLKVVPWLRSICFYFTLDFPRVGLGAALMALCMEAAFVPGAPSREISIEVHESDVEDLEEGEEERINEELGFIQQSWRCLHSNLSKCPTVCDVNLSLHY